MNDHSIMRLERKGRARVEAGGASLPNDLRLEQETDFQRAQIFRRRGGQLQAVAVWINRILSSRTTQKR